MKVRIGAIGPPDSLQNIREVAHLDSRIELVEFPYFGSEQLPPILTENRYTVDQWIFSGQTPYHYSVERELISEEEASFPPLHGLALLGTFLQAMQEQGRFVSKISLDTVNEEIVKSLFTEYRLDKVSFELLAYKGYGNYDEIIDFHVQNYESGKAEVAITCLLKTHLELQKLGIPSYRIVPSKLAIKTVLDLLVSRAQSHVYEKQQVAIIGFEIFKENGSANRAAFSFDEKKKELDLEQELLEITKNLHGSLINKGSGTHFIYTTQGDYEVFTSRSSLHQIINEIRMRTSLQLRVGIGSGYTICDAEQNVQGAFEYADKNSRNQLVHIDEEGICRVLDELQGEALQNLQLPVYWSTVLRANNYRETIPLKIFQYVKLKNIPYFTSELITAFLKNTDRNTRRILSELEQMGLIKGIPEENNQKKRGRPKKVFQLVMEKDPENRV